MCVCFFKQLNATRGTAWRLERGRARERIGLPPLTPQTAGMEPAHKIRQILNYLIFEYLDKERDLGFQGPTWWCYIEN